jgi:DNA-binding transcriptional ArsR family regulator
MKSVLISDKADIFSSSLTFEERTQQLKEEERRQEAEKQREKNSPFSRWTQFNNEHTRELMWLTLKHPKAHAILLFLIDQMDNYNAVMCSYRVLEEVINVGQATIARNIKVLKDNGFIAVLKSGTSNVYAVNHEIYWKSWGNNRKYSKFPANIVLTLSEQEATYQAKIEGLEIVKQKERREPETHESEIRDVTTKEIPEPVKSAASALVPVGLSR